MRHGRISDLIRRTAGALLLLGSVGVSTDTLTFAEDAAPTPSTEAPSSDDVYKRAGDRLALHLQQMGSPPSDQGTANCDNDCNNGAPKDSCLFGNFGAHDNGCASEPLGEPWLLVNAFTDDCGNNHLKDNKMTISGWSTFGYSSNNDGAFTGQGPFLTHSERRNFNVNQQYLYIEKKADITKDWDWGYRGDVLYGVDGYEGQSFGNHPGRFDFSNTANGFDQGFNHGKQAWAIPQLYAEVAKKDVSVKIGHFFTPTGYEVIPPAANFFYSHQITWYNAEAFYHTGALGTWQVNEKLVLSGGWVLGWDTGFDQFRGGNMGMFGMAYTISDKTTLSTFNTFGNQGWRGNGTLSGIILSHKFTDKLMTVSQVDVLSTDNPTTFTADGIARKSASFINYVYYEIDSRWKAGYRQELWHADGVSYQTHTWGVNYKPHANIIIRPEVRYMYAPGAPGGAAGTIANNIQQTYNGNTVFGCDLVLTF